MSAASEIRIKLFRKDLWRLNEFLQRKQFDQTEEGAMALVHFMECRMRIGLVMDSMGMTSPYSEDTPAKEADQSQELLNVESNDKHYLCQAARQEAHKLEQRLRKLAPTMSMNQHAARRCVSAIDDLEMGRMWIGRMYQKLKEKPS